jgi:serine/threonine-protein kinase
VLGDFGEVYVLDWGVARVLGEDHPDTLDGLPPDRIDDSEDWPLTGESAPTLPGAILGTPGYMSPEQLRADPDIGPASDIYALGCILFEILAGEPLHPRNGPMASTAMGADARPSRRVPGRDVSPELDAICVRATQTRAEDRYPTARTLANAVQRYLDGDRDLARRKEIARSSTSSRLAPRSRRAPRTTAAMPCAPPAARSRSTPSRPRRPRSSRTS